MSNVTSGPTHFPDINAVLQELLAGVRAVLGDGLVGLYLQGSLAGGDFDPDSSDIDVVVVTADELAEDTVAALRDMHERIAAGGSKWVKELEASYLPLVTLPRLDRYGSLGVEQHDIDWVIQRHIVREHGVALAGPDPRTLIDPVGPAQLRAAALGTLRQWWEPMTTDPLNPIEHPTVLRDARYRSYAVLTMCRILYTVREGAVASKPVAARWAQDALGEPWAALIERALAGRGDPAAVSPKEALDFVRFTVAEGRAFAS